MHIELLEEPELEFGARGRHVDTRFGLLNHGPLDAGQPRALRQIRLGIVGCGRTTESLLRWLEKCRNEIVVASPRQRNLHPRFPGFVVDGPFGAELVSDPRWTVEIADREWWAILGSLPLRDLTVFVVPVVIALGRWL